jgi:hypothetical protein
MGIYIDYALRAECAEEELRGRLDRVRERCLDLPLRAVGEVRWIAPIYNPITITMLRSHGHSVPPAIAERLAPVERDLDHGSRCLAFALMMGQELSKAERARYLAPARALMETTDLWKKEDLPEKLGDSLPGGFTPLTIYRAGIEFEFASILLRHGYLLNLDPGEGSETVTLALSTFDPPAEGDPPRRLPLWYGQGFTKTQYAKDFVQVHETVCRVLDILGEEGLLLNGSDNCGYYASRSWKDASKRVNEELDFARMMGGLLGVMIGNMREEGTEVQVLQDNASKAKSVDFSAALAREQAAESEGSEPPPA